MNREEPTHQPARVIVGHCPKCNEVVVVFNNYEVWPLVECKCSWKGGTLEIKNRSRYERDGRIFDIYHQDYDY